MSTWSKGKIKTKTSSTTEENDVNNSIDFVITSNTPEKPESLQKAKKNKSKPSTSPSSAATATFGANLAKVTRLFGRKENVKGGEFKLQGIVKKKATQKRPYVPQIKGMDKIKKYLIPVKESLSPKKKANLQSSTDQVPSASNNSRSVKGKGVGKKSKPLHTYW